MFPNVVDDTAKKAELLLAGVVTYYGKHYSTFFYNNKLMTWVYFDDARVRKVMKVSLCQFAALEKQKLNSSKTDI